MNLKADELLKILKSTNMKKILLISSIIVMIAGTMAFEILSSNGKAGYTNSPNEGNCTSCHSGTINSGPGSVTIASSPTLTNGYTRGATYTITVNVSDNSASNNNLFGVGVEVLLASGENGGTLTITDANLTQIKTATVNSHVRNNVVHTGNGNSGPNSQQFSFDWTAPATGENPVTFYAVGNAANNNGDNTGDNIYSTSLVVNANTTGIVENQIQKNIAVYPNPSNGRFQVEIGNVIFSNKYNLIIYNVNGENIYQSVLTNPNTKIDLNDQSKGNYYVKIYDGQTIFTEKIVIR